MRVGLIACSAAKRAGDELYPASDLYQGALFAKAKAYVERECDRYLILSALWNTLLPTDLIRPYDYSMDRMPPPARAHWASKTLAQLEDRLGLDDTIVCLASAPYREWTGHWAIETPLAGMGIGQQLGWLKAQNG